MSLHKEQGSQGYIDPYAEDDIPNIDEPSDLEHRKQVRRTLDDYLERKRLKKELEDEFDQEFDWDDFE